MKRVDDIAKSNLSLPAKWLAVFMAHHENRNGEVITTPSAIRAWTGLHRVTIYDAINEMEATGFLTIITPFTLGRKSSGKFAPTWGSRSLQQPNQPDRVAYNNQLVSGGAETADSLASAGAPVSPLSILSKSLSSPVQEDKQLGMESVSESAHEIHPAWLTQLHDIPTWKCSYDDDVIEKVAGHGITAEHALLAATALVAKWDGRKYKRADLAYLNWALGEKQRAEERNAAQRNGNGRYRAPGTDIPKAGTPEAHARWPAPAYDDA